MTAGGNTVEDPLDVERCVHPFNFLDRALGRLSPLQQREHLVVQDLGNRYQALGAFGMP